MPRIIFTSRYMKAAPATAKNLVKYIATRENVDKSLNDAAPRPATKNQRKTIEQLLETAPHMKNSLEYEDFITNPTMSNASELISETISQNLDLFSKKENFVEYMAKRPGAEQIGGHGLFAADDEPIELKAVQKEVANHKGRVWTHVVSLRREDAERLGYNNAAAWKSVVQGQMPTIAENMKISFEDLRWYAAFHNESHHPHIHLIAYSANPKNGYLTNQGIENMRSEFANEIFKQDLEQLYADKTEARNNLVATARERIETLMDDINNSREVNPKLENMIAELARNLSFHRGRQVYGFLKADDKKIVDEITKKFADDERIGALYDEWRGLQDEIISTYKDKPTTHPPLYKQEVFKPIKNAIINEVGKLFERQIFFDVPNVERDLPELFESETSEPELTKIIEASEQGNQHAQYTLGKFLYENDTAFAVKWLTASAGQGNQYAQYSLGKHFYYERDIEQAVSLFSLSAAQGNEYAAKMLDFIENGGYSHTNTSVITLLHRLGQMMQNRCEENYQKLTGQTDRKLLRKITQKKENLGQKMD